MPQKIAVGSDHAGLPAKEAAKTYLTGLGYEVEDKGTATPESVDYPDYAQAVGDAVNKGEADLGMLFAGLESEYPWQPTRFPASAPL